MGGGIDPMLMIKRHVFSYTPTIESVALSSPVGDKIIIYIRGGGGRFHLEGNLPSIMSPVVYYKQTKIYECCSGKYKTIVTPKKSPKSTLKEINPTKYDGVSSLLSWKKSIDDWKNKIVKNGILSAKGLMGHYNKDIIIDDGGKFRTRTSRWCSNCHT